MCKKCNDLGIVQATIRGRGDLLAKCSCNEGVHQNYQLPALEMLGRGVMTEPLPCDWFRPSFGDGLDAIFFKAEEWKRRVKKAERDWMEYDLVD